MSELEHIPPRSVCCQPPSFFAMDELALSRA